MGDYTFVRAEKIGRYITEHEATLRQTAIEFGVSKTTCHKDVTERLPKCNPKLAEEVRKVLMKNMAIGHIRGGQATKRKKEEKRQKQKYSY